MALPVDMCTMASDRILSVAPKVPPDWMKDRVDSEVTVVVG